MKKLLLSLCIGLFCSSPAHAGILGVIKSTAGKVAVTVNSGVQKAGGFVLKEVKQLPSELVEGVVSVKVVPTLAGLVTLKTVAHKPHTILVTAKTDAGKVLNYIVELVKPIPMALLDAVLVLKLLPLALWLL